MNVADDCSIRIVRFKFSSCFYSRDVVGYRIISGFFIISMLCFSVPALLIKHPSQAAISAHPYAQQVNNTTAGGMAKYFFPISSISLV